MKVNRLDHLVLTVKNIATTARFYVDVLGMTRTGATGMINSVYVRDPDRNLIELCTYL